MTKLLLARREAAARQHDDARIRWPQRTSLEFQRGLAPVVQELEEIARAMIAADDAQPLEIARSLMWLGDALFDLGQGGHLVASRFRCLSGPPPGVS